jgi:hypothetical protein
VSAFVLRAVRDGAAEVDHVHNEASDVTRLTDAVKPPMTPEQAERLLRDN